jgi:hypothetical protein
MATRMNVMKLLQEVRGLAELPNQHPPKAVIGPLLLQQFMPRMRTPSARRTLTVIVKDPPDIPQPVKIVFLTHPTDSKT